MQYNQIEFSAQQLHLQKVSRSFALTIPLLPESLVDYISNAYLLCRIADTVEDDPVANNDKKISWLKSFATFCADGFNDEMELLRLHKTGVELVNDGAVESELNLIKDMTPVIMRTISFPSRIRNILARGVAILSLGMAESLSNPDIHNQDDVDRYCYFVAGVVGELLAALFSEHNHHIDKKTIMTLSVSFGEGLQLTNILKDRFEDKDRGAHFLPVKENGLSSTDTVLHYISLCQGHLDDALDFILNLPQQEQGIRFFCLLNIAMATATIKLIAKDLSKETGKVKISRNTVKILYVLCKIVSKSNLLTKLLFVCLSRGVGRIRRDPEQLRRKVSCWDKDLRSLSLQEDIIHEVN